jgi:ElaB/YqjD/DUF883 family membrane-anchored ribosome-binding protein
MTAKHKRHNKKSKKSKVVGKRGGDNRYGETENRFYNNSDDSDRDSVDARAQKWFADAPNTNKYDNQNGWLAISVLGIIGVVVLGVTVIKRR